MADLKIPFSITRNLYWILAAGYIAILVASYMRFGILFQFSLGLYSLVALPIIIVIGRSKEFLRSWMPFMVLLLSYEALQGVAGILAETGSIVNLYGYDAAIWGFNLTGTVQNAFLNPTLTMVTTFLYSLHFPLIIAATVFLWYTDRKNYSKYVYAIVITSYLGLITFVLMPTAPPWYSGAATNILGNGTGPAAPIVSGIAALTRLIESDKFAAFPSLHGAYVMLFCLFVTRSRPKLAWVTIPLTFGVLFSTIYLGQHYVLDLMGGALYMGGAVALTEWLYRKKGSLFQFSTGAPQEPKMYASKESSDIASTEGS